MKHTFRWAGTLCAVITLFSVQVASVDARTVLRSGDSVSLAEDQLIEGDFYAAAGKVNISGSIEEDLVAAGGQMSINGSIGDNALLLGGEVDVFGSIGDDLRILSGVVTIGEPVMGDVFIVGGTVDILSSASVAGDVLVYGGEVTIAGSVGGDILGTSNQLRVDAPVAGNVNVSVGQLTLGERAEIDGTVQYTSNQVLVQALNASVGGETVRNDPVLPGNDTALRAALIPLLVVLFSVLGWYLVSRRSLNLVVARSLRKSPRPIFLGATVLFLAPIVITLLLVSVIGVMVGVAALLAYLLLVTLACIAVSAVVGQLLLRLFNQPGATLSLVSLGVGVLGIALLTLLPIVGQVVLMVAILVTMGGMIDLVVRPRAE